MQKQEYKEILNKWNKGMPLEFFDNEDWQEWKPPTTPPYYPNCEYRIRYAIKPVE